MAANPRDELLAKISQLSEEEIRTILNYIRVVHPDQPVIDTDALPEDYDEANDPSIGFFDGPENLSEQVEDILWAGFGLPKSDSEPKLS